MILLYKFFILTFFALLLAKPIDPLGTEKSVLISNSKKKSKNYKYYELDKSGLEFTDLGSFSNDDSLRIKLYIREVIAKEKKEKQKFKVDVSLNGSSETVSFKNKSMGKHALKNRPGWATTDAGIWFLDVKYSDFKNLRINRKSNEKLIIRTVVDKIDRSKLVSRTISTINSQKKYKIDTKSQKSGKLISRYWYKLEQNSDKLKFEVEGPTSIRVFSRISNPSHNSKANDYSLFIKENGLDIGTFSFSSELSSLSNLNETGEKVSKWRTCWINVPKGKHYYTISKGSFSSRENSYYANTQDAIIEDSSNTYIRVKRYDKD